MGTNSLRSSNFPDRFVRHKNFLAELELISSDLDKNDATFIMGDGLADRNGVSFESVNFPSHFLRHQEFRLKLQPLPPRIPVDGTFGGNLSPEGELFNKDATFFIRPGLADNSKVSFRSLNFDRRFLRHKSFHLVLDELDFANEVDLKDATFELLAGFVAQPPGPHVA